MTRYRLAVGPMAYCLRRGLLPAPRAVPIPVTVRLLSNSLPRAGDGTSTPAPPPAAKEKAKLVAKEKTKKVGSAVNAKGKKADSTVAAKGKKGSSVAALGGQNKAAKAMDKAASAPMKKRRRRKQKRGSNNWGPWGHRYKFMRRGPRAPGFKERKLDPETTTLWWAEKKLMKKGIYPIGSRRRRVAIRTSPNLPFEHMPYQCFQDALNVLRKDREEKLRKLARMEKRLQNLIERDPAILKGGQKSKERRIRETKRYIDELLILTDINDPMVKRNSEDELGDMNKPIYQKLARERWEEYRKKILIQRIEQFNIVPDVLPKLDITADVELRFQGNKIQPGEKLLAATTERPPTLKVQLYDSGERLVTVVVIDSDVPDESLNTFTSCCHFIATNIPLSPNKPNIILRAFEPAVPWLPPYSQRGSPYHRLGVYILEQTKGPVDKEKIAALYGGTGDESDPISRDMRLRFSLKSFRDKFSLKPFGFNMFRAVWDDTTRDVMTRHNIPGSDMVWKRLRDPRIRPLRKRRGWEAKRQGPKYRHLWKYTKRIVGWNDKKWRGDKREKKWRV